MIDIFKAFDGPLYIATQIAKYPSYGCLVYPTSMVNVITKENLHAEKIHLDFYDSINTWIQTCNGFLYPPQGSISLFVELCGKVVYNTFVVTPNFYQLQLKLGLHQLTSMQAIASPIHQCIKFTYDGEIDMINHSLYHPSRPRH